MIPLRKGLSRLSHSGVFRRVLAVLLPSLVVAYAAVLRLDAITLKYGPVTSPAWLHALQAGPHTPLQWLRPASMTWSPEPVFAHREAPPSPYTSDPFTYLKYARGMRFFYAAHEREPGFPFLTKVALRLLDNQDVAVSFASGFGSVLAVAATFVLGWYAFSWWVGLGAALAMAIESDLIAYGVGGWRDDAFMAATLVCACLMLRFSRAPSRRTALLMGAAAGVACLFRISSASFVLPGFVYLVLTSKRPWKERLAGVGLAAAVAMLAVAPYLWNCWREYGDPLVSLAWHTSSYVAAEGANAAPPPGGSLGKLSTAWLSHPTQSVDTLAVGMTTYPFSDKWHGFDAWTPGLGSWLSWTALLGLVVLGCSATGRLLLLVLGTMLIPFAVTWKVPTASSWRLTECAYPFFLIGAGLAVTEVIEWMRPSRVRKLLTQRPPPFRQFVAPLVMIGVACAGLWVVAIALPVRVAREAIRDREEVTITAGHRDWAFFGEGWTDPVLQGIDVRRSRGARSVLWIPLEGGQDYSLTLRLDPDPPPAGETGPPPSIDISLNGIPQSRIELTWTLGRVGSYTLLVNRHAVHSGLNRLTLTPELPQAASAAPRSGFRFWYFRIRPRLEQAPPFGV